MERGVQNRLDKKGLHIYALIWYNAGISLNKRGLL